MMQTLENAARSPGAPGSHPICIHCQYPIDESLGPRGICPECGAAYELADDRTFRVVPRVRVVSWADTLKLAGYLTAFVSAALQVFAMLGLRSNFGTAEFSAALCIGVGAGIFLSIPVIVECRDCWKPFLFVASTAWLLGLLVLWFTVGLIGAVILFCTIGIALLVWFGLGVMVAGLWKQMLS